MLILLLSAASCCWLSPFERVARFTYIDHRHTLFRTLSHFSFVAFSFFVFPIRSSIIIYYSFIIVAILVCCDLFMYVRCLQVFWNRTIEYRVCFTILNPSTIINTSHRNEVKSFFIAILFQYFICTSHSEVNIANRRMNTTHFSSSFGIKFQLNSRRLFGIIKNN